VWHRSDRPNRKIQNTQESQGIIFEWKYYEYNLEIIHFLDNKYEKLQIGVQVSLKINHL